MVRDPGINWALRKGYGARGVVRTLSGVGFLKREEGGPMNYVRRLKGHKDTVLCCIASRARPGIVASCGEDGQICYFDLRCKDVVISLDVGGQPVSSICFKPDNEFAIYASVGSEIKSFDLNMASSDKILESYNYNKEEINQISFSPKSSFLAAADDSGDVKVIDVRHNCLYRTLRAAHENICSSVQFLPWRPWEVITGGLDARLAIWEFSRGKCYKRIDFGNDDPTHANTSHSASQSINPPFVHAISVAQEDMEAMSQNLCAAARGDGVIDVINIESALSGIKGRNSSQARKHMLVKHNKKVSQDTSETSSSVQLKRLQLDHSLGGHTAAASCVAFSLFGENGKFVISGGNDASVKLWDWRYFGAHQGEPCKCVSINVQKKAFARNNTIQACFFI
ncbi:uncharacterized protein LOC116260955 isoform X2 [Nymphaea colorata]|uniref:uncharacterized protein LOC116260955 isoform X2 n=1 Tax=Nymphaea colorata TaxID=210225 RepID=UPI00214E2F65|nr:uncharacterized protein LOC116260955 isoform X2 [Nymphaea colorata]